MKYHECPDHPRAGTFLDDAGDVRCNECDRLLLEYDECDDSPEEDLHPTRAPR